MHHINLGGCMELRHVHVPDVYVRMAVESVYNALLVPDNKRVKAVRTALESQEFYNNAHRISKLQDGCSFAIPLSRTGIKYFNDLITSQTHFPRTFNGCSLTKTQFPPSKKELAKSHNEHELLHKAIERFLNQHGLSSADKDELLSDLPSSWEKHGDLIIFPSTTFTNEKWTQFKPFNHPVKNDESSSQTVVQNSCSDLWMTVASALKCKRLAINNQVKCNEFRSSGTILLLGKDGWVEHIDNGIKYVFDTTKVMFSSGNITEKLRVASFNCRGETVLDLYAGIGYFTLPYLVHAQAEVVHACEWNAAAVEALQRGLEVNGVKEKCVIHYGDNRKLKLKNFADRVNLGLIPSSEEGWPIACTALKSSTGGWLHVHGNVSTYHARPARVGEATLLWSSRERELERRHGAERNPWEMREKVDLSASDDRSVGGVSEQTKNRFTSRTPQVPGNKASMPQAKSSKQEIWEEWSRYVSEKIHSLLADRDYDKGRQWRVRVTELVHVKSYAPHVDHLVADVECRPDKI